MSKHPELIVMLTHNDRTVENAYEIFDACKDTKAKYWGFKEVGIPLDEMKKLCSYMKAWRQDHLPGRSWPIPRRSASPAPRWPWSAASIA